MSVTNSIVDFFQGNPFQNPIGSLIEKATDIRNEAENWTLYMEVCDSINGTEDGPKLAIRAIRRRINSEINKNNTVVMYALTLLETCVKNCGYRFHLVVCTRDLLQDFERFVMVGNNNLVNGRNDIPTTVRDKILYLIQSWYDSFKGQPDLKEINFTYYRLLECGVQYPMLDINKLAPIETPTKPKSASPPTKPKSVSPPTKPLSSVNAQTRQVSKEESEINKKPQIDSVKNKTMGFEQMVEKLSTELHAVQTNIDVLDELMKEYPNDKPVPDDALSLMKNLNNVCGEMQTRMIELINKWNEVGNEESSVLLDSLRVIDELNSVLAQYERYERSCNATQNNKGDDTVTDDKELINRMNKSTISDMYAAQQESEHFYTGFSKTNNQVKNDPSNTSGGALSSQEFDLFLNERSSNTNGATSNPSQLPPSNDGNGNLSLFHPDDNTATTNNTKSTNATKSSELFDL